MLHPISGMVRLSVRASCLCVYTRDVNSPRDVWANGARGTDNFVCGRYARRRVWQLQKGNRDAESMCAPSPHAPFTSASCSPPSSSSSSSLHCVPCEPQCLSFLAPTRVHKPIRTRSDKSTGGNALLDYRSSYGTVRRRLWLTLLGLFPTPDPPLTSASSTDASGLPNFRRSGDLKASVSCTFPCRLYYPLPFSPSSLPLPASSSSCSSVAY